MTHAAEHDGGASACAAAVGLYNSGRYAEALQRIAHDHPKTVRTATAPTELVTGSGCNNPITALSDHEEWLLDEVDVALRECSSETQATTTATESALSAACWMELGQYHRACVLSASGEAAVTSDAPADGRDFDRYARSVGLSAEAAFACGRQRVGVAVLQRAAEVCATALAAVPAHAATSDERLSAHFLGFTLELMERHSCTDSEKLSLLSSTTALLPAHLNWFHDMLASPYEHSNNRPKTHTSVSFWDSYASALLIRIGAAHSVLPANFNECVPATTGPVRNWPEVTALPALAALSQLAYRTRGYSAALRIAKVMLERWPLQMPASSLVTLVRSAVFTGDLAAIVSAVDHFTSTCVGPAVRPSRQALWQALLYWSRGCAMLLAKDMRCAQECFKRSTEVHPNFTLSTLYLAHSLSLTNKSSPAIRAYSLAATLPYYGPHVATGNSGVSLSCGDSLVAEAWLYLAKEMFHNGWYYRAVEALQTAKKLDASDPHVHNELGYALLQMNANKCGHAAAVQSFRTAEHMAVTGARGWALTLKGGWRDEAAAAALHLRNMKLLNNQDAMNGAAYDAEVLQWENVYSLNLKHSKTTL